jgi:hypothetical protein
MDVITKTPFLVALGAYLLRVVLAVIGGRPDMRPEDWPVDGHLYHS